jgi:hypothetical protein
MKKSLDLKVADKILEDLKSEVVEVLWNSNVGDFYCEKFLFPFFQEEAEYSIKKLNLSEKQEYFYLERVDRIMGEYSENIPYLGERNLDY